MAKLHWTNREDRVCCFLARLRTILFVRYRFWTILTLVLLSMLLLIVASNWHIIYTTTRLREWSINRFSCISLIWGADGSLPQSGESNSGLTERKFYISHGFHPTVGIGNLLFMYASLWGIAKRNGLFPTIGHTRLHDAMEIELPPEEFFNLNDCDNHPFGQEGCCIYDSASESISSSFPSRNVSLWGYFQSHRYFHPEYKDDIRRQMKFKPDVVARAQAIIDAAFENSFGIKRAKGSQRSLPIVGIHVRRGDILELGAVKFGYTVPTKEYYVHAVDLLQGKEVLDPVYIVCTNDAAWARENLQLPNMYLVEGSSPVVDLALLSMSDHLVLSTGTYSFFAGYLSDAQTVIYYARWPRPGSELAKMTHLEENWLPEWTGLD